MWFPDVNIKKICITLVNINFQIYKISQAKRSKVQDRQTNLNVTEYIKFIDMVSDCILWMFKELLTAYQVLM